MTDQIAMLPTPGAGDDRGHNPSVLKSVARHAAKGVNKQIMLRDAIPLVGTSRGLKLQPIFCEWMMNYPLGWTAISKE
jgi:hypothetical protein